MLVSKNCFSDSRHNGIFTNMTAHGHYIVPLKNRGKLVEVMFLYTDEDPPGTKELMKSSFLLVIVSPTRFNTKGSKKIPIKNEGSTVAN